MTLTIMHGNSNLNYITFVKSLKIMQGGDYTGVVNDPSTYIDTGDTTSKSITKINGYKAPSTYLSNILIHLK